MAVWLWCIPAFLFLFWLWMFWDMANNDDLPACYVSVTNGRDNRLDWMFVFVLLSVVTAGYYFFVEYGPRRRR